MIGKKPSTLLSDHDRSSYGTALLSACFVAEGDSRCLGEAVCQRFGKIVVARAAADDGILRLTVGDEIYEIGGFSFFFNERSAKIGRWSEVILI